MKQIIAYTIGLVALAGCGGASIIQSQNPFICAAPQGSMTDALIQLPSLTGIDKLGYFGCIAESETVVFNNQVLLIGRIDQFVVVYDWNSKTLIGQTDGSGLFTSALVVNNTLYVFSTVTPNITMTSTTDLVNWTSWQNIFNFIQVDPDNDGNVYNTSMILQDGQYVLAYEVGGATGTSAYSWRIATSTDMKTWSSIGNRFSTDYSACPVMRYINGSYQFIYLAHDNGVLVSKVARTNDFVNYEIANTIFLAPGHGEGTNTSDVSLTELNGVTYINYIDGNQAGWDDQETALYKGTMSDMFTQIWESGSIPNPTPGN